MRLRSYDAASVEHLTVSESTFMKGYNGDRLGNC
jgi:hypothetical protein